MAVDDSVKVVGYRHKIVVPMLVVARFGALRRSWRVFPIVVSGNYTSGSVELSFHDKAAETDSLGRTYEVTMPDVVMKANENPGGKRVFVTAGDAGTP